MKPMIHYRSLAKLFQYPQEGYLQDVATCQRMLDTQYPSAGAALKRFSSFLVHSTQDAAEEIYNKTFHIQAVCYLDLGYVIFGEDYKRGEFLVHMKEEQAKVGNDCGDELPDNLAKVLELLAMSNEVQLVEELAVRVVLPSLDRMMAEFDEARMQLREKVLKKMHSALLQQDLQGGNVYRDALYALKLVLESDFDASKFHDEVQQPSLGGAFFKNCGDGCSTDPLHAPVKQDLSVGML